MGHCTVAEAEEILDKPFPVLDKGFVRLVDYLGSDERIVQAARVSYGKGTKTYREDRALINYLLRNEHTSPFEQVVLTFHVKMPIFVARQWIRHRTARVNEISGRYSVLSNEFYLPDLDDIAYQSETKKQARSDTPVPEDLKQHSRELFQKDQNQVYASYQELVDHNIARELARINLPLSTYTEMYWQIDLHNLFHFIKLRAHPHAQKEIREYATILLTITKKVAPAACEAFENHTLGGISLSSREREAVQALYEGKPLPLTGKAKERFLEKLYPPTSNQSASR